MKSVSSTNPYEDERLWKMYMRPNRTVKDRVFTFHSMIPKGTTAILDLGCGTGAITNDLDSMIVVGADITLFSLKRYRHEKVVADATSLPFKDRSFDLLISSELLEHLPDGQLERAVSEIRSIHPMTILLSVPFKEDLDLRSSFCRKCDRYFNMYHHYRSFVPSDLDRQFNGYTRTREEFTTDIVSPSAWVISVGKKFGYYSVMMGGTCERCGSEIKHPPIAVRIVFGSLRYLSICYNTLRGRARPYHMILEYQDSNQASK